VLTYHPTVTKDDAAFNQKYGLKLRVRIEEKVKLGWPGT